MQQSRILTSRVRRCLLATVTLACVGVAGGQQRAIDTAKSAMTVHVYKAGLLSVFGHDHEISAPLSGGAVDVEGRKVELRVDAAGLRVQDANVSGKDREDIQATMLGAGVLDAANYKEIRFRSTSAEPAGAGAWKVNGELTLHGETRPVSMQVHERGGHYAGAFRLNITDFRIKPVKAAGGAVRVKDEVQIEFDIQLAR
ncbi:MAG: YceI family protein [Candidatus Sulfopaludibacter sp.]|nr:YceI family protein [Candidatus Sulfopaludibacter sp.]